MDAKRMRTMQVLILILQDSVVKLKEKCYPQTLLEECKDEIKYTKMEILIDDDLEKSSSDESDNESDNDSNHENELTMRKTMVNPINNLLKAKKSVLIIIKA